VTCLYHHVMNTVHIIRIFPRVRPVPIVPHFLSPQSQPGFHWYQTLHPPSSLNNPLPRSPHRQRVSREKAQYPFTPSLPAPPSGMATKSLGAPFQKRAPNFKRTVCDLPNLLAKKRGGERVTSFVYFPIDNRQTNDKGGTEHYWFAIGNGYLSGDAQNFRRNGFPRHAISIHKPA
jgi:hypothetical protein